MRQHSNKSIRFSQVFLCSSANSPPESKLCIKALSQKLQLSSSSLSQVFLEIDTTSDRPLFEFNTALGEDCRWEHVPTTWLPPACIPSDVSTGGCLAQVTGPHESIVKSGLRVGMKLTVPQMQLLISAHNLDGPPNRPGGLKPLKVQYIRYLVDSFLPELSEDERAAICKRMGDNKKQEMEADEEGDSAELLLKLVAALSPQEKPHFDHIIKEAVDQLEVQARIAKARAKKRAAMEEDPEESKPAQEKAAAAEEGARPRAVFARSKAPSGISAEAGDNARALLLPTTLKAGGCGVPEFLNCRQKLLGFLCDCVASCGAPPLFILLVTGRLFDHRI